MSELVAKYFNCLKDSFPEYNEVPESVQEVAGIIPSDIDVEKMRHNAEHFSLQNFKSSL